MKRVRDRRLDKIAAEKREACPVPCVLRVAFGETKAEAYARFNAAYPHRKPGHNVLVVPAKPSTPEEQVIYESRLFESQNRLVSAARSNQLAIVKADQSAPRR